VFAALDVGAITGLRAKMERRAGQPNAASGCEEPGLLSARPCAGRTCCAISSSFSRQLLVCAVPSIQVIGVSAVKARSLRHTDHAIRASLLARAIAATL